MRLETLTMISPSVFIHPTSQPLDFVVLSETKDLIAACHHHEILRFAQDDTRGCCPHLQTFRPYAVSGRSRPQRREEGSIAELLARESHA